MEKKDTFVEGLAKVMVKLNITTDKEAEAIKEDFYNRSKENFDYFLLDEGLVPKEDLLRALSLYFNVPYFDVKGYFFDHDLLTNFPKDFLLENLIIPVETDQEILTVVANRPDIEGLESKIRNYTTCDIEFRVGEGRDIIDAIREYYDESPTYVHDLTDEDEPESEEESEGIDIDDYVEEKDRW